MKFGMAITVLGVTALGLAGTATAAPGFGSVQDTINSLQARGSTSN